MGIRCPSLAAFSSHLPVTLGVLAPLRTCHQEQAGWPISASLPSRHRACGAILSLFPWLLQPDGFPTVYQRPAAWTSPLTSTLCRRAIDYEALGVVPSTLGSVWAWYSNNSVASLIHHLLWKSCDEKHLSNIAISRNNVEHMQSCSAALLNLPVFLLIHNTWSVCVYIWKIKALWCNYSTS